MRCLPGRRRQLNNSKARLCHLWHRALPQARRGHNTGSHAADARESDYDPMSEFLSGFKEKDHGVRS